jgi:hypothetical protein
MAAGVAVTAGLLGAGFATGEPAAQAVPPQHCVAAFDGNGCLPEGGGGGLSDENFVNYVLIDCCDVGPDGWSWAYFERSDGGTPTSLDVISLRAEEPLFQACQLVYRPSPRIATGIRCS